MNCIGVDDRIVESICNGLFQRNRELYDEDNLNEAGNIIYQPPPLHEVWLDEAGCCQGNEYRIHQRRWNEDLMRDCNRAVRKSIPPPVATDVDDGGKVPGVAPISDNGSVDSLLFSCASESEGDIWGNNNYDDDASNAHEGANLVPPDSNDKMEHVSLSVICQEYNKLNRGMFALTFWSTGNTTYGSKDVYKATALELQAIPLQHQEIW